MVPRLRASVWVSYLIAIPKHDELSLIPHFTDDGVLGPYTTLFTAISNPNRELRNASSRPHLERSVWSFNSRGWTPRLQAKHFFKNLINHLPKKENRC